MSITIDKTEKGYIASGMNVHGRYVTAEISAISTVKMAEDAVLNEKSEQELAAEKLANEKKFLLTEWVKGKTDDELIAKKEIFPRPVDGKQIEENAIYNYAGELFRAKVTFIYDNQQNPVLEPTKWDKIGKKEKSKYQQVFDSAQNWMRDQTYKKGTYVKRYGKLYQATGTISDNSDPEAGGKWKLIKESDLNETV